MPRLAAAGARQRLAAARVARLASVTAGGEPHIVPVTFAVDGDTIYTAVDGKPKTTRVLRRLDNIRRHPGVAVLADHYAEDWTQLWWARADGLAAVIEEPGLMTGPVSLLGSRYPQYREVPLPGPVIAIRVTSWTGWAASAAPAADAASASDDGAGGG